MTNLTIQLKDNPEFVKQFDEFSPSMTLEELKKLLKDTPHMARKLRHKQSWYILMELIHHGKSFGLDDNAAPNQIIHHIISGKDVPLCDICCTEQVAWEAGKNKYKKTCGSKNCVEISSKNSYEQTMLNEYGVTNIFAAESFKESLKERNREKYGVDHYVQSKDFREKYVDHMMDAYGVEHYLQNAEKVAEVHAKMIERDGKLPQQKHINPSDLSKLNDLNWLITEHHTKKRTLTEMAEELKVDKKILSDRLKAADVSIMRHPTSSQERILSEFLEEHDISFINNDRTILGNNTELDFYIPDSKVAIEFCGLYWHSDAVRKNAKTLHKAKYEQCKAMGVRLITIFGDEWVTSEELIKEKILNILGQSTKEKVYARKTKVVEVDVKIKSDFFAQNHIQGNGPSSINYGLEHDGELVAAIGFIKQKDHYILNRYATSKNVVGGFTKLLKHFEREYNSPKIITFADLRWSEGDLYENTGFKLDKVIPPDYFWCKVENRWHKFNWRHIHMVKKLENYDPELSETQNMHNHGFYKIWDCGKKLYTKTPSQ